MECMAEADNLCCRNGGIDTEKDYKYKAQDGVCNIAKEKRHVVTIDSYEDVPPNDESALKKVISLHSITNFSPPATGWALLTHGSARPDKMPFTCIVFTSHHAGGSAVCIFWCSWNPAHCALSCMHA